MAQFPSPICRWLTALIMVASGMNLLGQSPAPNSLVVPAYPTLAKIAKLEGTVVVEIEFGPAGLIQSLKVQEHDKKLSMLSYAVVTSVSKWRLVNQAGQKFIIPFVFQLLPPDCKDSELESKIDLFTSVTIRARKSPPIESSHFQDPPVKKQ